MPEECEAERRELIEGGQAGQTDNCGYALSKKARSEIMKKLIAEVERKPDRLTAAAKSKSKKGDSKNPSGEQKESKLIEIGD